MAEQFQDPKEEEVEDKTNTKVPRGKKIEDVANKAAEKAGKRERNSMGTTRYFPIERFWETLNSVAGQPIPRLTAKTKALRR